MSKTYNLTATLYTGRSKTPGQNWTAFDNSSWPDWVNNKGYAGKSGDWYYATAMQFNSSTLSALRNKTVTSVTLTVNCTQAMNGKSYISYKYNNTWSGSSGSQAWTRSVNGGSSPSSGEDSNAYTISSNSLSTGTKTFTLKRNGMPYSGVPVYGLVVGPDLSNSDRLCFSSATLHVTTDETDYTYTLSYNSNGGSGSPSSQQQTVTGGGTAPSMTFTISNTRPTRTGYDFLGWSKSDTATTASYQPGGYITVNGNTTLYAVWKAITYTVSYNANGGSGAPTSQTKNYNESLTLSSTAPSRTGHTFLGWSPSSTATSATYCTGPSHTTNNSYTANASATMYAVWQVADYTITYRPGTNGSGSVVTDTKTYNEPLTLRGMTFTRSGYVHAGWATSDGGAKVYDLYGSYTDNASATLYPVWIAAKSTVTATNGNLYDDNNKCVITITNYDPSFTHTLTYEYGNASGVIAFGLSGASPITYDWKPPLGLASQFPSAKSGTCVINCTTHNGVENLGTSTTTCTLTIPSSVCCTVDSVTVEEAVAGLASQFDGFVQGYSKAKLTGTISSGSGFPAYGATVVSYAISVNGQTLTSNGAVTGVLNSSGSYSYSFTITDTRGYTNTYSDTFTVLPYSAPTISATAQRGSPDITTIDVTYSYSISPVTNNGVDKNTKSLSLKYKPVNGSYTTVSLTASSYSGYGTYQITGIDGNTAYEVVVTASDYFGSASTTSKVVPTGYRVFDIASTDLTMTRHGICPGDGWDHQYFKEQFHEVIDVVPRRCYARLPTTGNSSGWYRVMEYSTSSQATAMGGLSFVVDFVITRANNATDNETHCISLVANYNDISFTNESSKSNTCIIDKIRFTNNGATSYVDIHYNVSGLNWVCVDATVHVAHDHLDQFKIKEPTKTADSPVSPETEVTVYTFSANVGPTYLKQYVETTAANYTIGSGNYIEMDYPLNLTGNQVVSIGLATWSTNSGPFSIFPYGTSVKKWYIVGAAGTTITNARFKFWYID